MESTHNEPACADAGILDNALVLIAVLDESGRVLSWNRAAEAITGFPAEEVLGGRDVWRRLYPDREYREGVTAKIAGILGTKNYFENLETLIRTRSGEVRTILWNTRRIADGGQSRVVTVGVDVTAEREAGVFRESIIDNADVLIAVLDPDGEVRVWNKAAEMTTGYPADEVIGRRDIWRRLNPDPEYRRGITQTITRIISERAYFENLETTILTKDRDERIISWNTRQIGSGGMLHEIAIGRDITEQRRAEAALVAYMSEMTMRLKQPVGLIGSTLLESVRLIREGLLTQDEIVMVLVEQARKTAQIAANIQEFQRAIVQREGAIPDAYREFLRGE